MKHTLWKWIDALVGFHRHCICQDERLSSMRDGRYTVVILNDQIMVPIDDDTYQRGYDDALIDNGIWPAARGKDTYRPAAIVGTNGNGVNGADK